MKTKTILTPFFLCLILGINSTTFSMGLLAKLVCGLANKQEGTSLNSNFNSTNMCPIPDDKSPHYKDIEENFGKNVADSITTQPDFLQEDFELESQDEDKDLTWYCYSLANITEKEASILAESPHYDKFFPTTESQIQKIEKCGKAKRNKETPDIEKKYNPKRLEHKCDKWLDKQIKALKEEHNKKQKENDKKHIDRDYCYKWVKKKVCDKRYPAVPHYEKLQENCNYKTLAKKTCKNNTKEIEECQQLKQKCEKRLSKTIDKIKFQRRSCERTCFRENHRKHCDSLRSHCFGNADTSDYPRCKAKCKSQQWIREKKDLNKKELNKSKLKTDECYHSCADRYKKVEHNICEGLCWEKHPNIDSNNIKKNCWKDCVKK